MPKVIKPVLTVLLSIQKQNPVNKSKIDIRGNVASRRGRRPYLSIVNIPGMAKSQLSIPNPHEASKAEISENPAWVKIVAV